MQLLFQEETAAGLSLMSKMVESLKAQPFQALYFFQLLVFRQLQDAFHIVSNALFCILDFYRLVKGFFILQNGLTFVHVCDPHC